MALPATSVLYTYFMLLGLNGTYLSHTLARLTQSIYCFVMLIITKHLLSVWVAGPAVPGFIGIF